MCGRFVQKGSPQAIAEFFDIKGPPINLAPRYNVAPTQEVAVVSAGPIGPQLSLKKWGLIPSWSKDGKATFATFNARAESIREKPTYRQAFERRRCIVPADGFYEWTGPKGDKTPHLFERRDGNMLALAGLHDSWRAADGSETIHSFTIVVTAANGWMSAYHDRMPVILASADMATWLNARPDEAATLMRSAPDDALTERTVSKLVNSVKNEGPELVA